MYKTAVLALDLSPAERPALDWMPALRRWGILRLLFVHVIRIDYPRRPA